MMAVMAAAAAVLTDPITLHMHQRTPSRYARKCRHTRNLTSGIISQIPPSNQPQIDGFTPLTKTDLTRRLYTNQETLAANLAGVSQAVSRAALRLKFGSRLIPVLCSDTRYEPSDGE